MASVVLLGLVELLFLLPPLKLHQQQSLHHKSSVLEIREQLPSHLKSLKLHPFLHPFLLPQLQHRPHLFLVLLFPLPLFLLPASQSVSQLPLLYHGTNLRLWHRLPPRSSLWASLLHPLPLQAPLRLPARLEEELWVWSRPIRVIRRHLRDRVLLSLRHSAQTAR